MAQAARKIAQGLEENGVVRSAVFPNAVRDVRRARGYPTLRDFDSKVNVTYTRLAKIERGEIFPASQELKEIAEALDVKVDDLLIDPTDPKFDREKWAREHIEAKLRYRGGGMDAMRLGAALRVKRLQMGRSTTDMKDFGLPAATVSRIENADRPIERWDAATQRGIAKALGVKGARQAMQVVDRMYEAGELDDMLQQLFSPAAIEERNRKRLRALLAELPGKTARDMLEKLGGEPAAAPAQRQRENMLAVLGGASSDRGVFTLEPTGRVVRAPLHAGPGAIAIEMVEPVLGPGLPRGSVLVVDPHQDPSPGDVVAVIDPEGRQVRILSTSEEKGSLVGFSMASDALVDLDDLPAGSVVAKMVGVIS